MDAGEEAEEPTAWVEEMPEGAPSRLNYIYSAILLRTYWRMPPFAMYSTSASMSTLQMVSNSSFLPPLYAVTLT